MLYPPPFFHEQRNTFNSGSRATFDECTSNKIISNNVFPDGFEFDVDDSCFHEKTSVPELADYIC